VVNRYAAWPRCTGPREYARRAGQLAAGRLRQHAYEPPPSVVAARERNAASWAAARERERKARAGR